MRPGFMTGVLAFGLLATAVFVAWALREGGGGAELWKHTLMIFAGFTLVPLGVAARHTGFRSARLFVEDARKRGAVRRAALVFLLLVVASVATILVVVFLSRRGWLE